jgi:SAM-dependent methyltransferase
MSILNALRLPQAVDAKDLDLPQSTQRHRDIIQNKYFLKSLYIDFYKSFAKSLNHVKKPRTIIEFGSGGGFLKEIVADVITTEIIDINGIDIRCSATQMPFKNDSVDAFILFDVLHHIPDPEAFFREANRCLKIGGRILMIEPANTIFGRFIYQNFHHEAFDPKAGWTLASSGPLSSANGALPWIVFVRDRRKFQTKFKSFEIRSVKMHTPFRYLLSGGLSFRQLLPSVTYPLIKGLEWILSPLNPWIGMFMTIEIIKKDVHD